MTEEFLHYIWKFRLFNLDHLKTTGGEMVTIQKVGEHNSDAGPDFFNAKIIIGNTLWAGNVEVHINASDWKKHLHQKDKAYDNIILHVVFNSDKKIYRNSSEEIPTIELSGRINEKIFQNYLNFKSNKNSIPCEKQIGSVPDLIIKSALDKLLIERLEGKSNAILKNLKLNNNNWEETFYQFIARNFGFKINGEPFELLAKSLPSILLAKHKSSLLQIEAMIFGQAGMLDKNFVDEYPKLLQKEYFFLKQKFKLIPIENHLWKLLRLRPLNFPTIRLAQFSNLIFKSSHLFSKIIVTENINELKNHLNVNVSDYWETHYIIDKASSYRAKYFGDNAINNIIINTIVPFLFVYGKQKDNDKYVERALQLLEQTKGESNSAINQWKLLKMPVKEASSTQALLQLKTEYCSKKKCLNCNIGNYLVKKM